MLLKKDFWAGAARNIDSKRGPNPQTMILFLRADGTLGMASFDCIGALSGLARLPGYVHLRRGRLVRIAVLERKVAAHGHFMGQHRISIFRCRRIAWASGPQPHYFPGLWSTG
jgi:hypothetical protein